MKKHFFLIVTLITCVITHASSQSADSTKYLVGKWKVNSGSIELLAKTQLEAIKKSNPAIADQFTIESVIEAIKSSTYAYNSDGTYAFTMMGQQDTGTWKFSDDKKNILSKSTMSGNETSRGIINMQRDKLTLKLKSGAIITYDPVK